MGLSQSIYSFVRYLRRLGLAGQGDNARRCCRGLGGLALSVGYALKAATLSAAALVATPYAYAYDLAALRSRCPFSRQTRWIAAC
jgi:hypothetical protein